MFRKRIYEDLILSKRAELPGDKDFGHAFTQNIALRYVFMLTFQKSQYPSFPINETQTFAILPVYLTPNGVKVKTKTAYMKKRYMFSSF